MNSSEFFFLTLSMLQCPCTSLNERKSFLSDRQLKVPACPEWMDVGGLHHLFGILFADPVVAQRPQQICYWDCRNVRGSSLVYVPVDNLSYQIQQKKGTVHMANTVKQY